MYEIDAVMSVAARTVAREGDSKGNQIKPYKHNAAFLSL